MLSSVWTIFRRLKPSFYWK